MDFIISNSPVLNVIRLASFLSSPERDHATVRRYISFRLPEPN